MKLNKDEINALRDLLSKKENRSDGFLEKLYKKLSGSGSVELFVDGAADLHSKTAGIGGVLYREGEELYSFSEYLDDKTNNEAEYSALIRGVELSIELKLTTLAIFADSQLVVKQINGDYKVKDERMKVLHSKARSLLKHLDSWSIDHIPREQNKEADKLSKAAMVEGQNRK